MRKARGTFIRPAMAQYAPRIELIEEAFEIPQLGKTRKIWALLPHDYYETEERYPVMYLQDAQNLFDDQAPFGNWGIDRAMAHMSAKGKKFIVIAIDHAGKERISEYSPYFHREFGDGQGKSYARFIIETLKPYVDKKYRSKAEREHTGIGGSSMGGLISAYIGIVHPKDFGNLMIFSPSFWFSDEIYFDAFNYKYVLPSKIYIYAGDRESRYMSEHIHRFKDAVKAHPYENPLVRFQLQINPNGEHQESFWGEEFPRAIDWLFFENKS